MGERMFKTLITHYILETCIDILMSNIKKNFAQKPKVEKPRGVFDLWINTDGSIGMASLSPANRLYISREIERINRICENTDFISMYGAVSKNV